MRKFMRAAALTLLAGCTVAGESAEARITRIEITKIEPAFSGQSFGDVGPYERLIGKAYGEVDPMHASNATIQDIGLAPHNPRGMVEYVTEIEILRPAGRSKSNGVLFFYIANRGNKGGLALFNADMPFEIAANNNLASAGDGFMLRQGYTIIWFGWQGDVAAGNGRLTMKVPVARNPDGSSITGLVRSELTTSPLVLPPTPATTLNLSSGWFTAMATTAYPTVSTDNQTPLADGFLPQLTLRRHEFEPRTPIPNGEWSFGACNAGNPVTANDTQICYPAGFKPGLLYEVTYRAKDPLVLGLGYAAARDLGSFFKSAAKDDAGNANPALVPKAQAIVMGTSQSGRFVRSLIHLGFNQDEEGRIVFEGAFPHIGGGLIALNVRFGQPGRAAGTGEVDRDFPGADFPFTYGSEHDPITGKTQALLDRCLKTSTCPKIVHVATALEMWELRQSLGFTDPLGTRDLPDPPNVRSYMLASTQHSSAPLPLRPAIFCQQQSNPNPHSWTVRALLQALVGWIKDDVPPPPSARPTIAAGTLVAPDQVHFPAIPATSYDGVTRPAVRFLAAHNPLHVLDYGNDYRAEEASGVLSGSAPKSGSAEYGVLVPQVDADGNDVDGIRNVYVQVAIGTYTGWNLFNQNFFEDGFCTLQGSFIPFARTKAERIAAGDPRLSLEERYPDKESYVSAVRKAANDLVAKRYLLAEDARRLVSEAEKGVRTAP